VQPADAGGYTLLVTNLARALTSTVATLTVISRAAITLQPPSQTNIAGSTASFTVSATGTPPLAYQWRFKGAKLADGGQFSGATTSTLTISNVQPANAGSYTVQVTGLLGSVLSVTATLTVFEQPSITAQPASRTNTVGSTATFSATATGTGPLSYQWQLNGLALSNGGRISGATTRALTITKVQPADAGGYTLLVTNVLREVGNSIDYACTSAVATLTVLAPKKPGSVLPSPLTITGIGVLRDKTVQLSVNALPNRSSRIEASIDLVNWTALTGTLTQSGTARFIDMDATNFPSRFYRAVSTPQDP